MFGPVSTNLVDPIYPAVYGTVTDTSSATEMFDMCLAHPQATGVFHYHAFAPCVGDSSYADTASSCASISECANRPLIYGENAYSDHQSAYPIGIIKDGHIIYGPYTDAGAIVDDCDVDVCNGAWINGVYGYFATTFHPYLIGCYGPGSNSTLS